MRPERGKSEGFKRWKGKGIRHEWDGSCQRIMDKVVVISEWNERH